MNYRTILDSIADRFSQKITTLAENVNPIFTENFGWKNHRWISNQFRMAHVERYSDSKIEVLHVTTFPHIRSPEPIFGFDVICTDNKVVGAYMDLSPGLVSYPFDDGMDFQERKPLPEWATVFSDRFILLKPISDAEFLRFCDWAIDKYVWYIDELKQDRLTPNLIDSVNVQTRYCEVQASNPRTYSVLKTKIGEERAKYFMQNILFPKP